MIRNRDWGRFVAAGVMALLLSGYLFAQESPLPPIPTTPPPNLLLPSPVPTPPPVVIEAPVAQPTIPVPPPLPSGVRPGFKIDPNTPVKELLPVAPKSKRDPGPVLGDDLSKVPDADFQAMPEQPLDVTKMTERTAHQLAKINHLNAKKTDGFMVELLENRPDLAGLPFAMGDDCRTSGARLKQFTQAVGTVRQAMSVSRNAIAQSNATPNAPQFPVAMQSFWSVYAGLCDNEDARLPKSDKALAEHVTVARIAALMQMLAAEPADIRLGLVKYLTGVPHAESTRALARLAIFSVEDDIHQAAVEALKVRREKDYTDILLKGLRYPWPAVAKRSADTISRMGRTDLIPELLKVLDEADPRMPQAKKQGWIETNVVREVVKVNHHRNCAMCHAPMGSGVVPASAMTAEVPIPGQAFPDSSTGYGRSASPDLMIRVDVTYLRQDFSVLLAVGDAHPWPEMQRFDFIVRERKVNEEEATIYRQKLMPKEEGVLSPYHKAALAALRQMTGKDTAPTAAAWRKLLAPR